MYVCVYVCLSVCLFVCVYVVCVYACMYVCMSVCLSVCLCVCSMCVCMYVCMYVRISSLPGFLEALRDEDVEFTIVTLRVSSAIGAVALGTKAAGLSLPLDFAANTTVLFHYKPTGNSV